MDARLRRLSSMDVRLPRRTQKRVSPSALSESLPVALKGTSLSWPVCRVELPVLRESDPKCKVSMGQRGKEELVARVQNEIDVDKRTILG